MIKIQGVIKNNTNLSPPGYLPNADAASKNTAGEIDAANLLKQSIVHVSQLFTVAKRDLDEKIGRLSQKRVRQILDGLSLVLEPRHIEYVKEERSG